MPNFAIGSLFLPLIYEEWMIKHVMNVYNGLHTSKIILHNTFVT